MNMSFFIFKVNLMKNSNLFLFKNTAKILFFLSILGCNTKKETFTMETISLQNTKNKIALFKKDTTLIAKYISSIYDAINLEKNKNLNLFTSNPSDFKDKVLLSLNDLKSDMPLYGLPIVVKDNFNTKDFPTSAGTPALESFIPKEDAPIIKKLKNAGAVIIGKTNMHELAFGITSNNAHFGAVKNPYASSLFAGGSSGGTAAAIAAKIVSVGLGTDTGGSCRIPAALCGVFGFRPTAGFYDSEGVIPLSTTRDTPGLLANSIEDIILLDEIITTKKNNEKVAIKTIRIGIPKGYFYDNLSKGVKKISNATLQKLRENNIELIVVDIEGIPNLLTESINIVLHETYVSLNAYLNKYNTNISYDELVKNIASPDVKGLFNSGAVAENSNYNLALKERENLREAYKKYFSENNLDVILYPTTPLEARPIKGSDETVELNGKQEPTFPTYIRNMNPGSYAGLPGVSIPAGKTDEGLPVGMHLEGAVNSDKKLLKIAAAIHQIIRE
jgi:mandelamide amidase